MSNIVKANPVENLVIAFKERFTGALQNGPVSFEPFLAAVLTECVSNPRLKEAAQQAPETLMEQLMVCANAKLLPGRAHGLFYLIPRWSGRTKRMEVTSITGYRGLCTVAQRHPRVHLVDAFVVYEGEPFEFNPGENRLSHQWRGDVDRSDDKIVCAYAKAILTAPGSHHVVDKPVCWVMTMKEILAIRDRSEGYRAFVAGKIKDTPWASDFAKMVRKTPLRALLNGGSVPTQQELMELLAAEPREEEIIRADAEVVADPGETTRTGEIASMLGVEVEPVEKPYDPELEGMVDERLED